MIDNGPLVTAYSPLKRFLVPGQKVAIVGSAGALSHLATQFATTMGASEVNTLPSPRPSEGADYDLVINTRSATRLDACMAMLKPKGVLACVGPCKAGGASAGGGLQAAEALAACFYRYHVQSELSTQGGQRSSYLGPYLPQEDAHDFARAHGICCEPAAEVYPIERMDFALVRVRGDKGHRRVVVGVGGDASA